MDDCDDWEERKYSCDKKASDRRDIIKLCSLDSTIVELIHFMCHNWCIQYYSSHCQVLAGEEGWCEKELERKRKYCECEVEVWEEELQIKDVG